MPHISIEYSANVEDWTDMAALCDALRQSASATGLFDPAGVRVRATRCDHVSVADGKPDRGFVDISVRLRGGRPADARKRAAQLIFDTAQTQLETVLESRPLALSLEMRNIDPELSPKVSSLRRFVRQHSD